MKKQALIPMACLIILSFLLMSSRAVNNGAVYANNNNSKPTFTPTPKLYSRCRFISLKSVTGNLLKKQITFEIKNLELETANLTIFGLGDFEIKDVSCKRFGHTHLCEGWVSGISYEGPTRFYAGELSVNSRERVCTASKIQIPPPN